MSHCSSANRMARDQAETPKATRKEWAAVGGCFAHRREETACHSQPRPSQFIQMNIVGRTVESIGSAGASSKLPRGGQRIELLVIVGKQTACGRGGSSCLVFNRKCHCVERSSGGCRHSAELAAVKRRSTTGMSFAARFASQNLAAADYSQTRFPRTERRQVV